MVSRLENGLAPAGTKLNQEFFDRLPALLSPFQMRLVTGLDYRELVALEQSNSLRVWRPPARKGQKRTYRKYYKTDAAKVAGFKM